ncbi:MAG: hypothetical protein ACOVRK_01085 [Chryseobacterium taeanense]
MNANVYTVRIKDETASGKILNDITISLKNEIVTIKEIITARVISEVDDYNSKKPDYFNGLIQPTDAEKTLNGFKMMQKKYIDPEKQVYIALDAFLTNGYFVLVDDRQASSLDEQVLVEKSTTVSFVKLTPLVGG